MDFVRRNWGRLGITALVLLGLTWAWWNEIEAQTARHLQRTMAQEGGHRVNVPGVIHKFGRNTDIDVGQEADLFDGGKNAQGFHTYNFLTSAKAMQIVSSSANDAAAGTGARTILLKGLDGDYEWQQETVTMNGTDSVAVSNNYLRMFFGEVATAGSGGENAGTLKVIPFAETNPILQIDPGNNRTAMAVFTIPADCEGDLRGYWGQMLSAAGAGADISLMIQPENGVLQQYHSGYSQQFSGQFYHEFQPPLLLEEKTDILVRISKTVTSSNADISGGFDLVLYPKPGT